MKTITQRVALAAATLLLVTLAACQSIGITADTFNKKLEVGYALVESTGNVATQLATAGKLKKDDVSNVIKTLEDAKLGLDVARSSHDATPAVADQKLQATLTVLEALQTYLNGVK